MLAVSSQPVAAPEPKNIAAHHRPVQEERRDAARLRRRLEVTVRPVGFSQSIVGRAKDLSEGGMYLLLESPTTLSVGQRCELEMTDADADPLIGLCGECHFATVVRTDPVTFGEDQMLGAGLRFDQPLFLS